MSNLPRVLLVDDNALVRRLLREQLTARGLLEVVAEAGDAATAVRLAVELRPDVAVLDLSMPGTNGFEAIAALRAAAPATDVVVMSGFAGAEVADGVLAAGAVAYLEKGLRVDLTRAILDALDRPSGGATAGAATVSPRVPDPGRRRLEARSVPRR